MIRLKSNAKINTYLKVLERVGNMHSLDTDIIKIDLENIIELEENKENKDNIYINNKIKENSNTEKTLKELRNKINIPFYTVKIKSNIPISAGLGSSSTDSAEIIKHFAKKFSLSEDSIKEISLKIGSDVYALTKDYPVRLLGFGETLEKIKVDFDSVVIIFNDIPLSTEQVFKKYDETKNMLFNNKNDLFLSSLILSKEFEEQFIKLNEIKKGSFMSGSGSAMFYIERENDYLTDCELKKLKENFKFVNRVKVK